MKRFWIMVLCLFLVFACGCGEKEDPHPDWDPSWVRAGEVIGVEKPEGFEAAENSDALSLTGIFYYTWTSGEPVAYTNEEEKEAFVYDAQIYLLVLWCKGEAEAQKEVKDWLSREQEYYQTKPGYEFTANGQTFEILPLLSGRENNPYTHGAAAFSIWENYAISAELLCADSFEGDAEEVLQAFLNGFHYE